MNKHTFIQLIKNPSGISSAQLLELEKVVQGFPYCQATYILIAKQAADTGSMLADQKVKKASAYTLDRKNLKRILFEKNFEVELNPHPKPIEEQAAIIPTTEVQKELPKVVSEITIIEEEVLEVLTVQPSEVPSITTAQSTESAQDQIIRELSENLRKLQANKLKSLLGELPSTPTVTQKTITPEIKKVADTSTNNSIQTPVPAPELLPIQLTSIPAAFQYNPLPSYPIRMEDVVIEISEIEAEGALFLEYLDFMEEKRGIFRKNKRKEGSIIDFIIKNDPSIPKLDINNLPDNSVDLSSKSITISKSPVSENFAKILGLQGKKEKAIDIYEQLILKNPEKKPYFESLIEKLKNKI